MGLEQKALLFEHWKPIAGYEDYYVSSFGRVKSFKIDSNGRMLSKRKHKRGYNVVSLSSEGVAKYVLVHRLVAEAFIPNPYGKPQVNHIDGNKINNDMRNLEWVTQDENMRHAVDNGLLDLESNTQRIKREGKRKCISVEQRTIDGKLIKVYPSVRGASESLGHRNSHSRISACCRGKAKTAFGYKWNYV